MSGKRSEITLSGAGEDFAVALEAGAMAGTVPGLVCLIPFDDAAQMRTDGGKTVELVAVVPVHGNATPA